jgi:hypothetical protein
MEDGTTVYLGSAYFSPTNGDLVHHIQKVKRFTGPSEAVLYEREDGSRDRQWGFTHEFPTLAEAEAWCADELERLIAPTVETIRTLREQAAARVASEEVVSV